MLNLDQVWLLPKFHVRNSNARVLKHQEIGLKEVATRGLHQGLKPWQDTHGITLQLSYQLDTIQMFLDSFKYPATTWHSSPSRSIPGSFPSWGFIFYL